MEGAGATVREAFKVGAWIFGGLLMTAWPQSTVATARPSGWC